MNPLSYKIFVSKVRKKGLLLVFWHLQASVIVTTSEHKNKMIKINQMINNLLITKKNNKVIMNNDWMVTVQRGEAPPPAPPPAGTERGGGGTPDEPITNQ